MQKKECLKLKKLTESKIKKAKKIRNIFFWISISLAVLFIISYSFYYDVFYKEFSISLINLILLIVLLTECIYFEFLVEYIDDTEEYFGVGKKFLSVFCSIMINGVFLSILTGLIEGFRWATKGNNGLVIIYIIIPIALIIIWFVLNHKASKKILSGN